LQLALNDCLDLSGQASLDVFNALNQVKYISLAVVRRAMSWLGSLLAHDYGCGVLRGFVRPLGNKKISRLLMKLGVSVSQLNKN
jgi:hypothetical protein